MNKYTQGNYTMATQDLSIKDLFHQTKVFIKQEIQRKEKYRTLELRCIQLERNPRKTNKVIYGLDTRENSETNCFI